MKPVPFRVQQVLAFAAIYLIWGSTFLGIRYAIESLPGFAMAATRFVCAGTLFLAWARWRGESWPTLSQWFSAVKLGALLLLLGNGAVVWAEHYMATGLVALLIATEPVWLVVLLGFLGERPTTRMTLGVFVGFAGAALLALPGLGSSEVVPVLPALVTVAGSLAWACGSLYSRNADLPRSLSQSSGMQMLCGGLLLGVAGALSGEWQAFEIAAVTTRSWLALGFLLIFGSLIAFTAYTWLLRTTSPSLVSTYAFVNPLVAVFLGWLLVDEAVGVRTLSAGLLVVISVLLVSGTKGANGPTVMDRPTKEPLELRESAD